LQILLSNPAPQHFATSDSISSQQAAALLLQHLFNVITALEIVAGQQGG